MTDKKEIKVEPEQLQLELVFTETYAPLTDTVEKEASIKLSAKQIREGLIAELTLAGSKQGARNFVVLLAIASFMDSNSKAFPSQIKLSEITGYSRTTIINAIKDLEQLEVGGQKILERKKVPSANKGHFKTIYKFASVSAEDIPELAVVPEVPVVTELTAREVVLLFCEKYEQQFGVQYMPNWARDIQMINQKLMGTFSDAVIKDIIRISVEYYEQKWANKNYPYPSIGQICSWLANEAVKVSMQESKKEEQFDQRVAIAETGKQLDALTLLDM